jgi:hypothetical protein
MVYGKMYSCRGYVPEVVIGFVNNNNKSNPTLSTHTRSQLVGKLGVILVPVGSPA